MIEIREFVKVKQHGSRPVFSRSFPHHTDILRDIRREVVFRKRIILTIVVNSQVVVADAIVYSGYAS